MKVQNWPGKAIEVAGSSSEAPIEAKGGRVVPKRTTAGIPKLMEAMGMGVTAWAGTVAPSRCTNGILGVGANWLRASQQFDCQYYANVLDWACPCDLAGSLWWCRLRSGV